MKSLKSLIALTAIVTLSFGCASVTDASLTDNPSDAKKPEITKPVNPGVFSGGADVKPIIDRPVL